MAEVSDYTIVRAAQITVPAVNGSMSDPVELGPFPAGGHTGSDGYIEFLYRGLRDSQAEVHLNGKRIAHIPARSSSAESEWFHHSIVVSGSVLGQVGNRLEFLRVTGDQYYVANVIAHFKQNA